MSVSPDRRAAALAAEQRVADRVHDRIDELRERAWKRARAAAADRTGSTFQARFERDVVAHHEANRSVRFTFGDREQVVFGRLDHADGATLHVGRVSVLSEDGEALLADWRAPASAPFYQATPADPQGVARRRTLVADGRQVRDLDDELLDADAADRLGLDSVTGQGALLAALERERSDHMRDIVATIQADQDRIIRLPDRGTVVVTGGPGTGKTVVALHRVAYLLYTHRQRFTGRGVLVVGPSRAFTEYIARVLPALGEDQAVLRPVHAFAPPGTAVEGWDDVDVAALKGDLRMVEVVRRSLAAGLPPIPPETLVTFDGTSARVGVGPLRTARHRLLRRLTADVEGQRYHDLTEAAEEAMRAVLWRQWRTARTSAGLPVPEHRVASGFDVVAAESAAVEMLRRCFWPVLDPLELLDRLRQDPAVLAAAADGLLDPGEQDQLARAWDGADRRRLTVDDVAIADELVALVGPPPGHRPHDEEAADRGPTSPFVSDRFRIEEPSVDAAAAGYTDYAHVVVDEAQDLTPLQWRMVGRRGPLASWTVVGDLAQRSRVAEPATWEDVADLIGRRHVEIARLDVNYRTPREVVAVAREVLARAGMDPASTPDAVRSTGERPRLVRTADVTGDAAREVVAHATDHAGTVALLVPDTLAEAAREALDRALADLDDAVRRTIGPRVRVLDPRTAKGLEFDDVVVAAPDEIAASSQVGWHLLYVAVTRATSRLVLVARPDVDLPGVEHMDEVGMAAPATG